MTNEELSIQLKEAHANAVDVDTISMALNSCVDLTDDEKRAFFKAMVATESLSEYARIMALASVLFPWLGRVWAQKQSGHEIQHALAAKRLGKTPILALVFLRCPDGIAALPLMGHPESCTTVERETIRLAPLEPTERDLGGDWQPPR